MAVEIVNGRNVDVISKSTTPDPSLSIVVAIYGAQTTLIQALESLCAVNMSSVEIVCVDDNSPDSCGAILSDFAKRDKRITVLKHLENAGYGASMNDGISLSRGKWIGILEPDDYIYPDTFASVANLAINADFPLDMLKTPYIREIRSNGTCRGSAPVKMLDCSFRCRVEPTGEPFCPRTEDSAVHLFRHHPSIWSAIYNRQFLDRHGIKFEEYPGGGWADNEFFYKTLLNAEAILYIDEPFYVYREETSTEFDSFRKSNPSLPFERWHSMQDVIDDIPDVSEAIMAAHIATGFTYIGAMRPSFHDSDESTKALVYEMFDRMDEDIVSAEGSIRPNLKRLFFDYRKDIANRKTSAFSYIKYLIGEFLYFVRQNGLIESLKKIAHR